MEAILSLINPELWFKGSDVRDALGQIIQIANDSITATAEKAADEAVKAAVTPIKADLAAANIEKIEYRKYYEKAESDRVAAQQRAEAAEKWAIAGWCAAGGAVIVEIVMIVIQIIVK
jgi:hypothetical protein